MEEGCDPSTYYSRVRSYMSGWRGNATLPEGLAYGDHGTLRLYGETGVSFYWHYSVLRRGRCHSLGATPVLTASNPVLQAQSAIIPSFDAFLGIQHELDQMREYLLEMR